MNREIKFRLWNPERKCITAGNELLTILLTTDVEFVREFNRCNMVWMQFTGLYDKNGKEIYEGDVLKEKYTNPLSVVFENGAFCFENDQLSGNDRLHQMRTEKLEIIGHIYE